MQLVLGFTFVVNLVTTLAYAVPMVGVKTGRIAVAFALFNILALVSRTANAFQAPLLAKQIEQSIQSGTGFQFESQFRWLLVSASVATAAGILLIPTFQRLFSKAVLNFSVNRSASRVLLHAFSKAGIKHLKESVTIPSSHNISELREIRHAPISILLVNTIVVAFLTTGVFSALYAGCLNPALRNTASNLSAVINGVATILLTILIDPYFSAMTDDVREGKASEVSFRKNIVLLVVSRLIGTGLAQLVFVPGSKLILSIAKIL